MKDFCNKRSLKLLKPVRPKMASLPDMAPATPRKRPLGFFKKESYSFYV
jgi:hypothetical protein